jgi:hypothetical protein
VDRKQDEPPFVPLDGLAYGVAELEALLVIALSSARLHAAWVRADARFRLEDVAMPLRDAYRSVSAATSALGQPPVTGADAGAQVTIELGSSTVLLQSARGHVIAALFERALPLGMARLIASRFVAALLPELPALSDRPRVQGRQAPPTPKPSRLRDGEEGPRQAMTLTFPPSAGPTIVPGTSSRPEGQGQQENGRARSLLHVLEERAPEPHVVLLRVALRTGLAPAALEAPESLGPEAIVLLENAVEDILGIDQSELADLE